MAIIDKTTHARFNGPRGGEFRVVKVSEVNGKNRVDIRLGYTTMDDEERFTQKGVQFAPQELETLIAALQAAVTELGDEAAPATTKKTTKATATK